MQNLDLTLILDLILKHLTGWRRKPLLLDLSSLSKTEKQKSSVLTNTIISFKSAIKEEGSFTFSDTLITALLFQTDCISKYIETEENDVVFCQRFVF